MLNCIFSLIWVPCHLLPSRNINANACTTFPCLWLQLWFQCVRLVFKAGRNYEVGETKASKWSGKGKGNLRRKKVRMVSGYKSHYEVCVSVKRMTESNIELDRQEIFVAWMNSWMNDIGQETPWKWKQPWGI